MTGDEALRRYASDRDPEAFRTLVTQYERLVYAAARRRLARAEDVDDVVQTTFLTLARAAGSIRRSVASWLYATAVHLASDLIRRDATRRRHETIAATEFATGDADDRAEWGRLSLIVDEEIAALPVAQRTLIVEHYLNGRSQRDLAAEQGVSQPTVLRHLHAAVADLRERLKRRGCAMEAPAIAVALDALPRPTVPAELTAGVAKIGVAGVAGKGSAAIGTKGLLATLAGVAAVVAIAVGVASNSGGTTAPTTSPVAGTPAKPVASDWMQILGDAYSLAPGENLKFVPPPPSEARQRYFREVEDNDTPMPFVQWRYTGNSLKREWMSGSGPQGQSLAGLLRLAAGLDDRRVDARDAPQLNCDGDWIVRDGATPDELLVDLQRIVRDHFKVELAVDRTSDERDAIVATGTYRFRRLDEATDDGVQLFADALDHPADGDRVLGGGTASRSEFWATVGDRLGMPVADETRGMPLKLQFMLSWSLEMPDVEQRRTLALANLSRQTGLNFHVDRRTFHRWRLSTTQPTTRGPRV